jgi:general secretion pathway protein G
MRPPRSGFTLIEVLIVIVVVAILAATILPYYFDSTKDASVSIARFNLSVMRSQIDFYRPDHNGKAPATLDQLAVRTDIDGNTGSGPEYKFGPYIPSIPTNPLTTSDAVKNISSSPPTSGDVTGTNGWLYNPATGEIWIDHPDYYLE